MDVKARRMALASVLLVAMAGLGTTRLEERHMSLVRSEPAKDTTVMAAPTELRLHWTQTPRLPVTAVRVTGANEHAVPVGALSTTGEGARVLVVPVGEALAPGVYTVTWRTAGDDGHILNGTYKFTYATR